MEILLLRLTFWGVEEGKSRVDVMFLRVEPVGKHDVFIGTVQDTPHRFPREGASADSVTGQ